MIHGVRPFKMQCLLFREDYEYHIPIEYLQNLVTLLILRFREQFIEKNQTKIHTFDKLEI